MATKRKSRAKQKATASPGEPNVQFVGKTKLANGTTVEIEDAPPEFNSGQQNFKLPPTAEQKAGFYLPAKVARQLRAEYPTMYKEPRILGAKKTKSKPKTAAKTKDAKAETGKTENSETK